MPRAVRGRVHEFARHSACVPHRTTKLNLAFYTILTMHLLAQRDLISKTRIPACAPWKRSLPDQVCTNCEAAPEQSGAPKAKECAQQVCFHC